MEITQSKQPLPTRERLGQGQNLETSIRNPFTDSRRTETTMKPDVAVMANYRVRPQWRWIITQAK